MADTNSATDAAAVSSPPALGRPAVHTTVAKHGNQTVIFNVTLFEGSVLLWIGDAKLGMDDIQAAAPTPYDSLPSVATLKGELDGPGSQLAQKLSKKFRTMVFLSFNLTVAEGEVMLFVQKESNRILAELLGQ
eukprot:TRINITY_DN16860_c0_g3_i1.p1 TRINITY_DN16860_c0_g3~~TRINITY_DN16860_c0_g3_i1.p1  ORF type:complete len:133 (+),score=29.44 TRINITY_DN16860_c0_g3_i1:71-469(+)